MAWSPATSRICDHGWSHPVVALECCQSEEHVLIHSILLIVSNTNLFASEQLGIAAAHDHLLVQKRALIVA